MSNKKLIADRIASFMKQRKMSQAKLATILKEKGAGEVTQATISNWASGHTSAPLELAPVFCDIFGVSLYEFFDMHPENAGDKQVNSIESEFKHNPDDAFKKLVKEYTSLLETSKKYRKEKDGAQKRLDEIYSVFHKI